MEKQTNVKEQVLAELENNRGAYVSGARLASRLSISRNAVWKAVSQLNASGYRIQAVPNRGYRLPDDTDILSAQSVSRYLAENTGNFRILTFKTVDSTNNQLKALAGRGEAEGLVVIADGQTAGRGRMNRRFYSPAGTGLYMSLLLRPAVPAAESPLLTAAAAAAVAEAVEEISGRSAQIKWVNDILLDGKKVCGILSEAALDLESGGLEYAVLGVGVNVRAPAGGFPEELHSTACPLFAGADYPADGRSRLAAAILNRFWPYYRNLGGRPYIQAYRERSAVVGKEILILRGAGEQATALSIDDNGRLIVRHADGSTEALCSGEVSVRSVGGDSSG